MDAIVTAGGIPLPEEPLYDATMGNPKALVDVAGKPMVQWVLDALSASSNIDNVIVVGLTDKSGLKCEKKMYFVSNQGKMVENLQAGAQKVLEINNKAEFVLIASSDIPAITGQMVDWVVETALEQKVDIVYNVIPRQVMEKRFPGSKRTWTKLSDMEICGGDLNAARISLIINDETEMWEKITNSRKNPLKQAALIGYDTAFLLLTGRLSLQDAETRVMKRMNITGKAVVSPFAEVGMDVDKPHQLEIMRADLAKRNKQAEKSSRSTKKTAGHLKITANAGKVSPAGKKTALTKKTAGKSQKAASSAKKAPARKTEKAAPLQKKVPARKTTKK
jgi:GTP:adenosylcobinamide-phosphate guanylyltransferase